MADARNLERGEIQDHMPVMGSDGHHVGTVDAVAGEYLKLAASDPAGGGRHRFLPLGLVRDLEDGAVHLRAPAAKAAEACISEEEMARRLRLDPEAARALGAEDTGRPHGSRGRGRKGSGRATTDKVTPARRAASTGRQV